MAQFLVYVYSSIDGVSDPRYNYALVSCSPAQAQELCRRMDLFASLRAQDERCQELVWRDCSALFFSCWDGAELVAQLAAAGVTVPAFENDWAADMWLDRSAPLRVPDGFLPDLACEHMPNGTQPSTRSDSVKISRELCPEPGEWSWQDVASWSVADCSNIYFTTAIPRTMIEQVAAEVPAVPPYYIHRGGYR